MVGRRSIGSSNDRIYIVGTVHHHMMPVLCVLMQALPWPPAFVCWAVHIYFLAKRASLQVATSRGHERSSASFLAASTNYLVRGRNGGNKNYLYRAQQEAARGRRQFHLALRKGRRRNRSDHILEVSLPTGGCFLCSGRGRFL